MLTFFFTNNINDISRYNFFFNLKKKGYKLTCFYFGLKISSSKWIFFLLVQSNFSMSNDKNQGCPDPTEARQPGQTARRQPDSGPNRRSCRSATGFRSQKPTPAGRVAGSHLQNPSNPNLTRATKKSSQIRPNPTISSEKKMQISEKIQFSGENFLDSSKNFQFLAKVPGSGDAFFHISMPFLIPTTNPTRSMLTITEN